MKEITFLRGYCKSIVKMTVEQHPRWACFYPLNGAAVEIHIPTVTGTLHVVILWQTRKVKANTLSASIAPFQKDLIMSPEPSVAVSLRA